MLASTRRASRGRLDCWGSIVAAAELLSRHIYWRSDLLPKSYHDWRDRRRPHVTVDRSELSDGLQRIGITRGALVMVHSAIHRVTLKKDSAASPLLASPISVAGQLLSDLSALVGDSGTLVMPTHPHYPEDPGFMHDKSGLVCRYDPVQSRSQVGLVTEMFRRQPGVIRSLHPLSTLACRGSLAQEITRDNLNRNKPLPHGIYSGYYRFSKLGGTIVSLGKPLIKCLTAIHVAEEVRDSEWPVKGFFYERRFLTRINSKEEEWIVRERRPEFVRSLALTKLRRDLVREGILNEAYVSGLRVDWANAGELLRFMLLKNRNSAYPYYFPRLSLVF